MKHALIILSLKCCLAVRKNPSNFVDYEDFGALPTEDVVAEAALERSQHEAFTRHHLFNRIIKAAESPSESVGSDESSYCPIGQHFQACTIAGTDEGNDYSCGNTVSYLKGVQEQGKLTAKQLHDAMLSLNETCCSSSLGSSDPKCYTDPPPTPQHSPCTAQQKSHTCNDGVRAANACVTPWHESSDTSKEFACKRSWTGTVWCSHDKTYGGNWSDCEPCREEGPPQFKPIMTALRCLYVMATAGNKNGRMMTFSNGDDLKEVKPAFSAGKVVGTVALVAMVNEGILSWDTKPADVFDWWTKDPQDPRSRVEFHHLLSFISGFVGVPTAIATGTMSDRCVVPGIANFYTPEECAHRIYRTALYAAVDGKSFMNATNPGAEPGSFFQYNSYHLQIALAMAVKISKTPARALMKKYAFDPAGMKNSHFWGGQNPFLAGGLMTTFNDYDSFLQAYVGYKMIPKSVADKMETNVFGDGVTCLCPGCKARGFSGTVYPGFAMGGMTAADGTFSWGGNIAWSVNRRTGLYLDLAYSGELPYHSSVIPWQKIFGGYGSMSYFPMFTNLVNVVEKTGLGRS